MSYKEAFKDNMDRANKTLEWVTSDGDKPVDVAQAHVSIAQVYVSAAIACAVQDLVSEVHELVKKK